MTNSHDALYKIVIQDEKDRTITNEVTVVQPSYWKFSSLVYQQSSLRNVVQATAALLNATVVQAAIARTVTGIVTAIQPLPEDLKVMVYQSVYSALKGQIKVTDGTNFMPTMDAVARPGFVKLTDGDDVLGGVYDYITQKFSVATSRGAGKSTFTEEFAGEQVDLDIITPSSGKKLMIVGVHTGADADAGKISLDFAAQEVWRHYVARFKAPCLPDMSIKGAVDEPLVLNSTIAGEAEVFIMVNYREINEPSDSKGDDADSFPLEPEDPGREIRDELEEVKDKWISPDRDLDKKLDRRV